MQRSITSLALISAIILSACPEAVAQSMYRLQRPVQERYSHVTETRQAAAQFTVRTEAPKQSSELSLGRALIGSFSPDQVVPRPDIRRASAGAAPFKGNSALFLVPTSADLKRLSSRDVVLLIDKSRSMSEMDCPSGSLPSNLSGFFTRTRETSAGAITRWEWCRRETMHVASQLSRSPGSRMKLVLFDDRVSEFENVSLGAVSEIFNQFKPSGGTNATKALKSVIHEYLERRSHGNQVRPLSIVCITDGAPSSPRSLRDLIVETSIKMNHPGEIAISFLQIGRDSQGNQLLPELDYGLANEGARYDIVSSRGFDSVSATGLMRALLDTAR